MTESDNETKVKVKQLSDKANEMESQCQEYQETYAVLKEENQEMNARLIDTSGQLDVTKAECDLA